MLQGEFNMEQLENRSTEQLKNKRYEFLSALTQDNLSNEQRADILYQLAKIEKELGFYTDAYMYIKKAYSLNPNEKEYKKEYVNYKSAYESQINIPFEENKICVYAICKNESQFVERWYESMKEADAIVVLDTGSTDDTVEKLKSLGVTVKTKIFNPWRFDLARNYSLKLAPQDCNILVCTDLDEILEPGWAATLKEHWREFQTKRCYYKYTWSHLSNGEEGRTFCYDKIHSRGWTWRFPVHEMLWYPANETGDAAPAETINLFHEIHLHHYPDYSKSRSSYLPLLEQRAKENPDDWYGLIYLSHEYYYRGMYEKSNETLKNILDKYKNHYSPLEQASCYLFMGDNYKALQNAEEAIRCYNIAINMQNGYREPYLGLGSLLIDLERYEEAIKILKAGVRNTWRHYTWLERDTSWTYEPWDLLCLACFYGGEKKEAIVYAAKALSYDPENERLQNNLQLCLENSSDIILL